MRLHLKILLTFIPVLCLVYQLGTKKNENFCEFSKFSIENIEENTDVIALVLTKWQADHNRQVIRHMFATLNTSLIFQPIFLLAIENISNLAQIRKENEEFQDLLLLQIEEIYQNLPKKLIWAYHWIFWKTNKLKWVIKLDDDIYINITKFDEYLSQSPNTDTIHCLEMTGTKPVRDPTSQWYISKEVWKPEVYPPYCSGMAYILTPQIGESLFQAYLTKFVGSAIWFEDVFITGILAKYANVQRTQLGIQMGYMGLLHKNADFFVAHPFLMSDVRKTPRQRLETWKKLFL